MPPLECPFPDVYTAIRQGIPESASTIRVFPDQRSRSTIWIEEGQIARIKGKQKVFNQNNVKRLAK